MPLYGLIHDSPIIYAAQKLARKGRVSSRGVYRSVSVKTNTQITYRFGGIKFFDSVLHAELNTPAGDLWRFLEKRSQRAVRGAKAQVGKKTRRLMKSIHKKHLGNRTGQYVWIGSNTVPYAYIHHQGSRPHLILPNDPGGKLVFRKGSRVIVTPRVLHPGTRPNPYLRNQLVHFVSPK